MPLDVDPLLDLASVKCFEANELLDCWLERPSSNHEKGRIVLKGKRGRLLEAKFATVSIKCNDHNGKLVSDELQIRFSDGNVIRVFPREVDVNNNQVSFMIFRNNEIKLDQVRVVSESGELIDVKLVRRSSTLVGASFELPKDTVSTRFRVSYGESDVWVRLLG